jgi:hypothetical protein
MSSGARRPAVVWPPPHRRDRQWRSLARTDPARCGKPAWVPESVRLATTVGDLQAHVLIEGSALDWLPTATFRRRRPHCAVPNSERCACAPPDRRWAAPLTGVKRTLRRARRMQRCQQGRIGSAVGQTRWHLAAAAAFSFGAVVSNLRCRTGAPFARRRRRIGPVAARGFDPLDPEAVAGSGHDRLIDHLVGEGQLRRNAGSALRRRSPVLEFHRSTPGLAKFRPI